MKSVNGRPILLFINHGSGQRESECSCKIPTAVGYLDGEKPEVVQLALIQVRLHLSQHISVTSLRCSPTTAKIFIGRKISFALLWKKLRDSSFWNYGCHFISGPQSKSAATFQFLLPTINLYSCTNKSVVRRISCSAITFAISQHLTLVSATHLKFDQKQ